MGVGLAGYRGQTKLGGNQSQTCRAQSHGARRFPMANRSNRVLAEYSAECSAAVLRYRNQGSALLLVLFAIILLTGLITATVGFVKNDVDEYGALNKEFRARQLAEPALAFGLAPPAYN